MGLDRSMVLNLAKTCTIFGDLAFLYFFFQFLGKFSKMAKNEIFSFLMGCILHFGLFLKINFFF